MRARIADWFCPRHVHVLLLASAPGVWNAARLCPACHREKLQRVIAEATAAGQYHERDFAEWERKAAAEFPGHARHGEERKIQSRNRAG